MTLVLRAPDGATAVVHPHGAHVTSWRPMPDGDERLFLSECSHFGGGAAIRGGIPIIFPQFATEGPLPRHGFARTSLWELASESVEGDGAHAAFQLAASDATRAIWPAEFLAQFDIRVTANELEVALSVENTGHAPFTFTAALHTYLRVRDIVRVEVTGLEGVRYRESSAPSRLIPDTDYTLRIRGEIDRVYVDAPQRVLIREPERDLALLSDGFPDVVIWNPGAERAAKLEDMEPGGERHMLCVEAAAVQIPVVVEPGARWSGSQVLIA
ncbi:MAG: D-hexose-6-phosphate mutarotase [Gemmatimonadaceae bacterium]